MIEEGNHGGFKSMGDSFLLKRILHICTCIFPHQNPSYI